MIKNAMDSAWIRRTGAIVVACASVIAASAQLASANICYNNGCQINLTGHLNLVNNWWGVAGTGASGSQSVWTNTGVSSSAGGSSLSWTAGNNIYGVKSYSGMYDGWNYSNGYNGAPFPREIQNNQSTINSIDGFWPCNGSQDTIWDSFYTYNSYQGSSLPNGPNMEIEVYINASFYPSNPVAQFHSSYNGWTWNVYKGGSGWPVWLFVPLNYPNSENFNLMEMAHWLYTTGRCAGTLYMQNDNFGAEPYYTNGSTSFGWNHISAP